MGSRRLPGCNRIFMEAKRGQPLRDEHREETPPRWRRYHINATTKPPIGRLESGRNHFRYRCVLLPREYDRRERCAMRTTVALAVFLMFAVSASGQALQRPQTPQPQQQPQLRPRVRAIPIPNWPADKPAPVIPIPTQMNPQSNLANRGRLRPQTPIIPSRPRIIEIGGAAKAPATAAKPTP